VNEISGKHAPWTSLYALKEPLGQSLAIALSSRFCGFCPKITKTAPNTVHLGAIVRHTISLATLVHIVVIVGGDSREMGRFLTGLPSCERGLWAEQG